MKTTNEIFDFLVRNAVYDKKTYHLDSKMTTLAQDFIDGEDDISLQAHLEYIPPFHVDLDAFLLFAEENEYSYKTMLKPLVDEKLISIVGDGCYQEGDPYNTDAYQIAFDQTIGLVSVKNRKYIRFWLGDFEN